MPRVKGGTTTKARRKKILKLAKGYYGSRRTLYKTANEQVMKSLAYAYRDRKQRKRNFRKLWISRINAAAVANGIKYSRFINGLSIANIEVNRKVLADLAVNNPATFTAYVEIAKKALATNTTPEKVVLFDVAKAIRENKNNQPAAKPVEVKKEKVVKEAPVKSVKVKPEPIVEEVKEEPVVTKPVKEKAVKPEVKPEPVVEEVVAEPVVKKTTKTTKKVVAEEAQNAPAEPKAKKDKLTKEGLQKLSIPELKDLAKLTKLTGISKLNKGDLIDALLNHIKA